MTTQDDHELGDSRIAAASRLAAELPAVFPGGPSYKVGTPIYQSALVQTDSGEYVSFTMPSATAMALNLAIEARDKAKLLRQALEYDSVLTPYNVYGKAVSHGHSGALFDFFEQCMVCTTFAFQALEVFCNHSISRELKTSMEVKIREKRHTLSPAEIERRLSTEEKLCQILPKVMNRPSPKGKAPWERFVGLKAARDATIHFKYADQQTLDRESLLFKFLSGRHAEYPQASIEMIGWFYEQNTPRWLRHMSEKCGGI